LRLVIIVALIVLIVRLAFSGIMYLHDYDASPKMSTTSTAEASPLAPVVAAPVTAETAQLVLPEVAGSALTAMSSGSSMLSGASVFFTEAADPSLAAAAAPTLVAAGQAVPLPPNSEDLRQPQRPMNNPLPPLPGNGTAASTGDTATPQVTTSTGMTADALARREFELNHRETQLNTREDALRELEANVNLRLKEAQEKEDEINQLILRNDAILAETRSVREEQQQADDALKDERVQHLVAAFKSMKPEQAAMLVNSMEDSVAVALLTAMPGRNAGLILGLVAPEKAARLVKAISEQRIDPRLLLENTELETAVQ
jgi:flagellar motility protein MotE (MotC chaperone)